MKEVTKEWIRHGEDDLRVAKREARVTDDPSYNAICFHSEQAVEKFLKGYLQENDRPIVKTHDLVFLLEQILSEKPLWDVYRTGLQRLSSFAVESRYPGYDAMKEDAEFSVAFAIEMRKTILESFS